MSNTLMVPIHLDALVLDQDEPVIAASADFRNLPYPDATRDVNGDTAYLSEEIVREPLQDENLFLKAGIHLHWSLPDTLTRGNHAPNPAGGFVTDFPAVPNRWLVRRSGPNVARKNWVVESDYLYPESDPDGAGANSEAVTFPVTPDRTAGKYCPFRFIGRQVQLNAWKVKDPDAEYLEKLTAVGYGDPTFAALYPNCRTVFGFHDDEITGAIPSGLQYDVIGWYSDPQADALGGFLRNRRTQTSFADVVADLEQNFAWTLDEESLKSLFTPAQQSQIAPYFQSPQQTSSPPASAILEAIENGLGLSANPQQLFPAAMLCYARMTFTPATTAASASPANPQITVANTGTEALSAFLAQQLAVNLSSSANSDQLSGFKSVIEDQLEALFFSARLDSRQLDVGAKFLEARHEKGFTAIPGGTLWTITKQNAGAGPADAAAASAQAQVTLPNDLAESLNNLNSAQQVFDNAQAEIESDRRQIFADWYKYLLCAYPPDDSLDSYPDPDEVRNFIELAGLAPLRSAIGATGDLLLQSDDAGNITSASCDAGTTGALAGELANALNDVLQSVSALNNTDAVMKANAVFRLRPTPAPRFYQPNNPVVLLTGPEVVPADRHGQDGSARADGLLECQLLPAIDMATAVPGQVNAISSQIDELARLNTDNFAFGVWSEQPWNPFLLEWEVELFPVEEQSNLEPESGGYQTTFINNSYSLDENQVDFSIRSGKGSTTPAANVYSGTSILTPQAGIQTKEKIAAYLNQAIQPAYYKAENVPPAEQNDDYLDDHFGAIQQWYESQNAASLNDAAAKASDPIYTALSAWPVSQEVNCLSQSLGGFNEALLMRKQTLQLDVADPLAFADQRAFVEEVQAAVQQSITTAPQPLSDFNPIRTGALKLNALRLVDTFGQTRDIDCSEVLTTERLKLSDDPSEMTLPPRLAQAARISFRWLAANGDEQEMNDHPASTPICGWILPNNLDSSLMIYDPAGKALGSIDEEARWEPAPGSNSPIADPSQISNLHLQKVVTYLIGQGIQFVQSFISALDTALANIDPENFAQHQDLALLMGRPIAVVRAAVDLQLQGKPAIHQGWNVFRQDLDRNERDTNEFDAVTFPIRLGEYSQFNDGLVGYWKEASDQYEGNVFYSPQSDPVDNPSIRTQANDPMTIWQTVLAAPQFLTMLVDPRGVVNATSGILPVKSISIPPDQYADALKAIEITFLATPILAEIAKLRLPLPAERGFQWSWLQKDKTGWTEISAAGIVRKSQVVAAFANGEAVWDGLKASGWIVGSDEATATIAPKDKRTQATLGSDLTSQTNEIEGFLASVQIGPVNQGAVFPGPQKVIEGWLKLSNA